MNEDNKTVCINIKECIYRGDRSDPRDKCCKVSLNQTPYFLRIKDIKYVAKYESIRNKNEYREVPCKLEFPEVKYYNVFQCSICKKYFIKVPFLCGLFGEANSDYLDVTDYYDSFTEKS